MMPFRDPFSLYYDVIFKPAIVKAKLKPIRADDMFRPSVIVSDLWQMVQDAKVLLAELTTKNANVFYELGLAHAIGKPVVLVSETMADVPFDLQQLRVLLYDKNDPEWGNKLSQGITNALKETLENPVEAVPNIFRHKVKSQAPIQDETIARIEALEGKVRLLNASKTERFIWSEQEDTIRNLGYWKELNEIKGKNDIKNWLNQSVQRGLRPVDLYRAAKANPRVSEETLRTIENVLGIKTFFGKLDRDE